MAGMMLGGAWIAWASLPYFVGADLHPFLVDKLPLSMNRTWRAVLYVHVVSALTTLPACLILMSRRVRLRAPGAHRILGRVNAVAVLLALVPSGAYLAFSAMGGAMSTVGFLFSGAITAGSMVMAVVTARRRAFAEHRRFTLHVVGQMSVAVISRLMLFCAAALELDPVTTYVVSLWLPVLGAAWCVERLHRAVSVSTPQESRGAVVALLGRSLPMWICVLLLSGAAAEAAPPPAGPAAKSEDVVDQLVRVFIEPAAARDSSVSRYSRAPRPPVERRARLTRPDALLDATGARFYTFAIDNRWSRDPQAEWENEVMVGCIYPDSGKVFLDLGESIVSSGWTLGRADEEAPPTACRAVPSSG